MTRPTLDAPDRRVLATGIILLLALVLLCVTIGAALGLGVRVFWMMAGW